MSLLSNTPADAGSVIPFERLALFLDLDGTLAPIEPHPDAVSVGFQRRALLNRLAKALDGRLAIVSGRTVRNVDRILHGAVRCVAGVHGLQRRRDDGQTLEVRPHARLAEAAEVMQAFAAAEPMLLLEAKPQSLALHYRGRPAAGPAAIDLAERISNATGLKIQRGDHVVELLTPGPDKGGAIRSFMAEAPFNGGIPVFMGDDLTDECGFAAVRELGGVAIAVGAEHALTSVSLSDPDAVFSRLEQALRIEGLNVGGAEWDG